MAFQILVPLATEVAQAHAAWFTGSHFDAVRGVVVDLDLRRGNWNQLLKLDPNNKQAKDDYLRLKMMTIGKKNPS